MLCLLGSVEGRSLKGIEFVFEIIKFKIHKSENILKTIELQIVSGKHGM